MGVTTDAERRADPPVMVSVVDTGKSALKLFVELWYALWHEAHH